MNFFKHSKFHYRILGWPGLKGHWAARFRGQPGEVEIHQPGWAHPCWVRIPSSDVLTFYQVVSKQEYAFDVNRAPEVIIDAGANIGLATLTFANRFPEATIIALEPEASNFALLQKNTAAYPNVTPVQAALWHEDGELKLLTAGGGHWGFRTREAEDAATKALHPVRAVSVPTLMTEHGLEKIDLFKVDIEGAEKQVFADTSAWLPKVDSLIAELHERTTPGCTRSFYGGTSGFEHEWLLGENVYLSRGGCLAPPKV